MNKLQKLQANLDQLNVKTVALLVVDTLSELPAKLNQVKFVIRQSTEDQMIRSDERRIQQVLLSMLENAADEARPGSVINVDVSIKPLPEEDIEEGLLTA